MDNIRKFEPLWGVWKCESVLGKGSFGRVYKAVRHDGEHTYYSAVKHISVPADEQQLEDARRSGLYQSDAELSVYFGDMVRDVQSEIDLMYTLKANTNIVSYEDHLVIPKDNGIGCDIFIRMELLRDLNSLDMNKLTEKDAVKIGTDICSALEVCARQNIMHRDIKPSNIFVNANGDYKLGDFGIAKVLNGATAGVSKKGTYSYMAPEIYKCEPANFTSDIYSLGVVLYRILNNNRLPFLPLTGIVRAQDQEAAMLKMVGGAPMPAPVNASPQMAKVILKACAYNKRDRYRNAAEFKNALIEAVSGVSSAPEKTRKLQHNTIIDFSPANEVSPTQINEDNRTQLNAEDRTQLNAEDKTQLKAKPAEKKEKSKKRIGGIIGAVGAVAAIVAAILIFFSWKNSFVYVDGERLDKGTTEFICDGGEVDNITALENYDSIEKIHLSNVPLDQSDIELIYSLYPDKDVRVDVEVCGRVFASNTKTLKFSAEDNISFDEISEKVKFFPNLGTVDLLECNVDETAVVDFISSHPDHTTIWTVEIFGQKFNSPSTSLNLSENEKVDIAELEKKISLFPLLTSVDLSDCGLSDDELLDFMNRNEQISVIWNINLFGTSFSTNVTSIDLSKNKNVSLSELSNKLKYFESLSSIDLSDCGLKSEDMWKFEQETGIDIVWKITLGKKTFKTNVTELDLSGTHVSDISKLKYCTDLEILDISYGWDNYSSGHNADLSDLSPLRNLTKLESLTLWGNKIRNLEPLSGLTNLTWLDLSHNRLSNIESLSGLTNLKGLDLSDNRFTNIKPLSGLTKLTWLDLFDNGISNIEPLSGMTKLTYLNIWSNNISNIEPLSGLTNLETLWIGDNSISNIEPLSGLTNLTELYLFFNKIKNIEPLSELTNLETLHLYNNKISNIEPLNGLTNLKELWLNENRLSRSKINALKKKLPNCDISY